MPFSKIFKQFPCSLKPITVKYIVGVQLADLPFFGFSLQECEAVYIKY